MKNVSHSNWIECNTVQIAINLNQSFAKWELTNWLKLYCHQQYATRPFYHVINIYSVLHDIKLRKISWQPTLTVNAFKIKLNKIKYDILN